MLRWKRRKNLLLADAINFRFPGHSAPVSLLADRGFLSQAPYPPYRITYFFKFLSNCIILSKKNLLESMLCGSFFVQSLPPLSGEQHALC